MTLKLNLRVTAKWLLKAMSFSARKPELQYRVNARCRYHPKFPILALLYVQLPLTFPKINTFCCETHSSCTSLVGSIPVRSVSLRL